MLLQIVLLNAVPGDIEMLKKGPASLDVQEDGCWHWGSTGVRKLSYRSISSQPVMNRMHSPRILVTRMRTTPYSPRLRRRGRFERQPESSLVAHQARAVGVRTMRRKGLPLNGIRNGVQYGSKISFHLRAYVLVATRCQAGSMRSYALLPSSYSSSLSFLQPTARRPKPVLRASSGLAGRLASSTRGWGM